jgi:2'-5' RNA ligase
MRLFTALDPSAEVHQKLRDLLDRLRPDASLRWSRPEGLHLTLKFIGHWPETRLAEIGEALAKVSFRPFQVGFSGLGFFPNPKSPRVFWVGVQAPPDLAQLAGSIDRELAGLGIESDKRAYSPHLTMARIEPGTGLAKLRQGIEAISPADCGSFLADRFYLYESRPQRGGSIYTRIGEFRGLIPAGGTG